MAASSFSDGTASIEIKKFKKEERRRRNEFERIFGCKNFMNVWYDYYEC
jgi:hypothetical protein